MKKPLSEKMLLLASIFQIDKANSNKNNNNYNQLLEVARSIYVRMVSWYSNFSKSVDIKCSTA